MADGLSVWLVRWSVIPCQTTCGMRLLAGTVSDNFLRCFCSQCIQCIRAFTTMRYINLLFAYLLIPLLSSILWVYLANWLNWPTHQQLLICFVVAPLRLWRPWGSPDLTEFIWSRRNNAYPRHSTSQWGKHAYRTPRPKRLSAWCSRWYCRRDQPPGRDNYAENLSPISAANNEQCIIIIIINYRLPRMWSN